MNRDHYFYAWKNRLGETCFGETSSVNKRMRKYITGNGALPEPHFILKGNITTIRELEKLVKDLLIENDAMMYIDGEYYEWLKPEFTDFEKWVLELAKNFNTEIVVNRELR